MKKLIRMTKMLRKQRIRNHKWMRSRRKRQDSSPRYSAWHVQLKQRHREK
jgi:hypothetical protein